MDAIVYTSHTGSTERYARLLGRRTGLPVWPLAEAERVLPPGAEIVYLGWLLCGGINGYRTAAGRYWVRAVCAVGMGPTGSQTELVRRRNGVPPSVPVFTVQGGLQPEKLRGVYRRMLDTLVQTAGAALAGKRERTAEEDGALELLLRGGDCVRPEALDAAARWMERTERCGLLLTRADGCPA